MAEEVPAAAAATATVTKTKKVSKVMKSLPQDYVNYILAMKPMDPARFLQPKRISEESGRRSARVAELIKANEDLIRSIQEYYRHELNTKGYVEVEDGVEEVSDEEDLEAKAPTELF